MFVTCHSECLCHARHWCLLSPSAAEPRGCNPPRSGFAARAGARSHPALVAENLFLRNNLALFRGRKVRSRRANDSTLWLMDNLNRFFP